MMFPASICLRFSYLHLYGLEENYSIKNSQNGSTKPTNYR